MLRPTLHDCLETRGSICSRISVNVGGRHRIGGLLRWRNVVDAVWADRGKALEPNLFQAWGGKPSVVMLRHRDARIPTAAKDRYRAFWSARSPTEAGDAARRKEVSNKGRRRIRECHGLAASSSDGSREVPAHLRGERQLRAFGEIYGRSNRLHFLSTVWSLAAIVAAIAVSWKGDATSCSRLSISPHGPAACSLSYICSHSRLYTGNGSECRRKLMQNSYWRLVTSWAMTEKVEARRWYSKKRSDESVHSLLR